MYLNQVKFGSVLHHKRLDIYARVIGLREDSGVVHIEVHTPSKDDEDASTLWDLSDCMSLTPKEHGEGYTIYQTMQNDLAIEERAI